MQADQVRRLGAKGGWAWMSVKQLWQLEVCTPIDTVVLEIVGFGSFAP